MNFYLKRKERIIHTAIEVLDELGFQGLSTKEISKRQGVSEGALYKHFRSKNEVILGVLDYYSKFDEDIKQTIEINGYTAKEGVTYFITRLAEFYESYPAMTAILNSNEVLRHEKGVAHRVEDIFKSRTSLVKHLIEEGVKKGEIRSDIDVDSISDIIIGSYSGITLKWRIEGRSFSLKDRILAAHNFIMQSL